MAEFFSTVLAGVAAAAVEALLIRLVKSLWTRGFAA